VGNETILAALGAVLTLFIFSYLLGDNPLFRLALHIFVGVSLAYVSIVAIHSVLLPLFSPPASGDSNTDLLWGISFMGVLLGLLLLVRNLRGLSWLSDLSVAVLLGVGVAVAVGGAIVGTLVPQVQAATSHAIPEPPVAPEILNPLGQVIAALGTITGLMVFSFTARRPARRTLNRVVNGGARIGQWFVLIGFGAAYGGVLVASLAILVDRAQYLIEVLEKISGS
jgi:hypothetical protein